MTDLHTIFAAGLLLAGVATSLPAQQPSSSEELAHTRTEFRFTANGSFEQTAPLFGANEERKWAPGWNPTFIYPQPAHDQPGMVFKVAHDQMTSTWVNTAFDLPGGHIQYAYVLSDAMVTTIDIHLTRNSPEKTDVSVVYERTALFPEANEHVKHFAKGDAKADKEWDEQFNGYLARVQGESSEK